MLPPAPPAIISQLETARPAVVRVIGQVSPNTLTAADRRWFASDTIYRELDRDYYVALSEAA